jgi:hypothetical protein
MSVPDPNPLLLRIVPASSKFVSDTDPEPAPSCSSTLLAVERGQLAVKINFLYKLGS